MEDQRRSPRRGAQAAIVLDDGRVFHAGTVRDVSDTGLYVETTAPLEAGTWVDLSPLDGNGVEVKARVVHARSPDWPRGVGLELIGAPEDNARFMEAILGPDAPKRRARPRQPTIPPGQSGNS